MAKNMDWLGTRAGTRSARVLIGALLGCGVLILLTTIFIVIQILRIHLDKLTEQMQPDRVAAVAPPEQPPTAAPFTQRYEVEGITVSLSNQNQTMAAYAEFTLVLDCPNVNAKRWMELNRASIRDAVYQSTVSFHVEDFSSPAGFAALKKAILSELKARFAGHAPRDMTLKDWVIR